MIEWIVIVGLVLAMYVVIYKYEKKMDKLQKKLDEHHEKLEDHHNRINKNHSKLEEHGNHIDEMWVTLPKLKDKS